MSTISTISTISRSWPSVSPPRIPSVPIRHRKKRETIGRPTKRGCDHGIADVFFSIYLVFACVTVGLIAFAILSLMFEAEEDPPVMKRTRDVMIPLFLSAMPISWVYLVDT